MSLLMDALKKAEEAKRLAEGASSPAGVGRPELPPRGKYDSIPAANTPATSLPELPPTLALLDDQFANVTGAKPESPAQKARTRTQPPSADIERQEQARQAVQQVFAAKQTPAQRPFYIALGIATALAVAAIGAYFWWQLQPKSSGLLPAAGNNAVLPAAPASPATALPPSALPPQPARAMVATVDGVAPRSSAASTGSLFGDAARNPAPIAPAARARAAGSAAAVVKGELSDRAPAADATASDTPIKVSRGRLQVDPGVARGYRQFVSGNLSAARADYEQALRSDPRNTDALNGMAAISLSKGEAEAAEAYYQRALDVDPKDATAQSGLINLRGSADPVQAESRLKTLAAAQPDSHAAHFALGNLYASQSRWREAQQAYFGAYTAEPDNPDYQFNLAVALDHLRQPRLALQYYQSALAAAAARPAAFDQAQATVRVRELQQ